MTSGLDDRYAAGYDAGMQEYLKTHTVERWASFFTPHLRPGMSLLDAGCGPGTITVDLAALVAPGRLLAVDASVDEVEKTRHRLESAGIQSAHVEVGDVLSLPLEDRSVDAVFSNAVIDYLPEPSRAVEEFGRVLKPGGVIGLRSWSPATVIGPPNEVIEESFTLFSRVIGEYRGNPDGVGPMLGKFLKDAGFERIFIRPSFERTESRNEWESFCRAVSGAYSGGRMMETALAKMWVDESRAAEIAAAWKDFASDTSNCLGFAWVEAVAFKQPL